MEPKLIYRLRGCDLTYQLLLKQLMSWPLFPFYHRESSGKPLAGREEKKHQKKTTDKKKHDSAHADKSERQEARSA